MLGLWYNILYIIRCLYLLPSALQKYMKIDQFYKIFTNEALKISSLVTLSIIMDKALENGLSILENTLGAPQDVQTQPEILILCELFLALTGVPYNSLSSTVNVIHPLKIWSLCLCDGFNEHSENLRNHKLDNTVLPVWTMYDFLHQRCLNCIL